MKRLMKKSGQAFKNSRARDRSGNKFITKNGTKKARTSVRV